MTRIACVDLFCGAGGLTHGLRAEGLPVAVGLDIDPACQYPFEANNGAKFIQGDIAKTNVKTLQPYLADAEVKVLAGCAPCQPFSTYSQRYDESVRSKWVLLKEFRRLAVGLRPDVVTMENVPSVESHEAFPEFVRALRKHGYKVWHGIVDCSDYGLPQRRRRLVLLASLHGEIELAPAKGKSESTVHGAIGNLPPLKAGSSSATDPLHIASRLTELNLKRIRASRPGGSWRDWPAPLVASCHRKSTGRTYPGVYGRMTWDEPAPTLTTQFYGFGNGRFGHPEQDRAISLREGAILQSFPASYSFVADGETVRFKVLGRLIGNAVPVLLGRAIGLSIRQHLRIAPQPSGFAA